MAAWEPRRAADGGDVPGGRIGAVAAPLYVMALLRENRKSLRKLKALVEQG